MKRITLILLIVFLLILVLGAGYIVWDMQNKPEISGENVTEHQENKIDEAKVAQELHSKLEGNFPKMDGATSTIPLEAAIVADFEGISQEEAEAKISHSTTYGSFDNLVDGKCDLIFVPRISEEQKEQARTKGVELEIVPIVKEAFVFVLNAKNPVESLTQEQIRGIYTGEITNWKQVGGPDEEIITYQRDETSGSQNSMKVFMEGYNLIKPKEETILGSMNSILDVISGYDNGKYSIGYSVYAYAGNMYQNIEGIKFVKVDGVEPSYTTIDNNKYPLIDYTYAIYDKNTTKTNVKDMVEWLLTKQGQETMKKAGYAPVGK